MAKGGKILDPNSKAGQKQAGQGDVVWGGPNDPRLNPAVNENYKWGMGGGTGVMPGDKTRFFGKGPKQPMTPEQKRKFLMQKMQEKQAAQAENPYRGRGASNWTGWDDYYRSGGGGGAPPPIFGGGGREQGPPPTPEQVRNQRLSSMTPYDFGNRPPPPRGGPAYTPGMTVAPRNQWSGSQTQRAINKWNEFQQRRSQAMANQGQLPKVQDHTLRGTPTASRFNLGGNQLPTMNQQMAGAQGGNLNAALMNAGRPWQGPKG
jgi:hypothetical protein